MNDLREVIVKWARAETNVRAVLETGSFARGENDALSDLDIELHCASPDELLNRTDWFDSLAPVWAYQALEEPGFPTRLVLFEGGRKVDFALLPVSGLQSGELSVAARARFIVLLDKDGLAPHLQSPLSPPVPTPEAFRQTRADFWMESWARAKYLARGDLWHAQIRANDTQASLLQMLEWSALGRGALPRHAGHFVEQWTDEATRVAIPSLWSGWDDQWPSLLALCGLFARLEGEVAGAFDLSLQGVDGTAIRADIERIGRI